MKLMVHVIFTSPFIKNTVNLSDKWQGEKMKDSNNAKLPQKDAGNILKTIYEKNRSKSKASQDFLKILNNQRIMEQSHIQRNKKFTSKSDLDN